MIILSALFWAFVTITYFMALGIDMWYVLEKPNVIKILVSLCPVANLWLLWKIYSRQEKDPKSAIKKFIKEQLTLDI